jgi:hypothetical protein
MGVGDRIANIQHTAHHDAYGAGHPIGVAKQIRHIRDTNGIKIREESLDKLESDFGGNPTLAHEVESIAEHSIRGDTGEKSTPRCEKVFPCGFARGSLVGEVVEVAAEGIEPRRSGSMRLSKKIAGPIKTSAI